MDKIINNVDRLIDLYGINISPSATIQAKKILLMEEIHCRQQTYMSRMKQCNLSYKEHYNGKDI